MVDRDEDLEDFDTAAVRKGYVSVTPVHFDLTNYALLEEVKDWKLSLKRIRGVKDGEQSCHHRRHWGL